MKVEGLEDTQVKIALVGTSCTGKTSIARHIEEKYQGHKKVIVVEEAATQFFYSHQVKDRFGYAAQRDIQSLALENERRAHESGAKVILTDRGVMDAPIYLSAVGKRKGASKLWDRVRGLFKLN